MGLFSRKKPCGHYTHTTELYDLHTGGDGEIYVRSIVKCRTCDHKLVVATRLPNIVTEVLHESLNIGTLTRKDTDERKRVADALDVVYDNIDTRALCATIGDAVKDAMKKAFNQN